MNPENQASTPRNRVSLSFDLRLIVVILLVVIVGMLAAWQPWQGVSSDDQTISVTGEASISAEPDEFAFYPSYQFKNANKDVALAELTKKSDEVVAELKKLGVEDNKIKTNTGGGHEYPVSIEPDSRSATYTLSLVVQVTNRELAQKVQDYLVTTTPTGAVSGQPTFSDAKRKELESRARDEATKDARAKADQSAQNLGFKIGKVKSVTDGTGFGDIVTLEARDSAASSPASPAPDNRTALSLQPGENELNYSVTVEYFVK